MTIEPLPKAIEAESLRRLPGIIHGFFTRQGGVSDGLYASLNCGLGSSDERARVEANRKRVGARLGVSAERIATVWQHHSADVAVLDAAPPAGTLIKADAVATRQKGLAAAVLTADCAPVLFADPRAGVVAAAHAGWRGALSGILEATLDAMQRLGAAPETIYAAIGPAISQAAYEVGEDFRQNVLKADPDNARFFATPAEGAKPHFDLTGFVKRRLEAAGLSQIEAINLCTYENESLFYSYRRSQRRKEPDYGRQISAILLG